MASGSEFELDADLVLLSMGFIGPEKNGMLTELGVKMTERGTVYLMGRVTQREAARATEIVRGVPSVKRVVRVFEYITEDELKAMQPKPPKEESGKPTPVMTGSGM